MYEAFFGLREKPFAISPDPEFLYSGKKHSHALAMLRYGIQSEAGLSVITGEVGTGKTTLIMKLLGELDDDITVGLISNVHSAFGELLEWVAMAFDLEYQGKTKTALFQQFSDFLIQQYAGGKRTVLIIDEAQNLGMETLEELRMLTNINSGKHLVLQLILSGQPELQAMLKRPELRQLVQRISVDYHLTGLTLDETVDYIRHRMAHAGGDPGIFRLDACTTIHSFSRGIPRLINTLCDISLVYAFAEERSEISSSLVLDVISDKRQSGIFPLDEPDLEGTGRSSKRYSPEIMEIAVRMLNEQMDGYPTRSAAIRSIAEKIGCSPSTLRKWSEKHADPHKDDPPVRSVGDWPRS